MIYGIKKGTCGVYLIENNATGEKYPWRKFYQDVAKQGRTGFTWRLLEECEESRLLEREQHWFDKLKPTYNFDRPVEFPCESKKINWFAHNSEKAKLAVENRKKLYNTEEYKRKFKQIQQKRFCRVSMFDLNGNQLREFESYSECARWLNENTSFKTKNKVSKVREVCLGIRPSAFGYVFKNV